MVKQLIELYEQTNTFGNNLGMKLTVIQPGKIQYQLKITDDHLAIPKVAHGGVVATLVDGSLGVAGLSLVASENKVVSTVEFKVNYLKPARLGDDLTCSAEVVSSGKRILYIECEVINQDKQLIAKAGGTFNAYSAEKVFG